MRCGNDLTNEDKKRISSERQNAVRQAWKNEQNLVKEGKGTRNWTQSQRLEILETGRVSGYEGHHMKSVSLFPEYAGAPENIQFLSEDEHLNGAHQGSYHNRTNGYYNPETHTMENFEGNELTSVPVCDLHMENSQSDDLAQARTSYCEMFEDNEINADLSEARIEYAANEESGTNSTNINVDEETQSHDSNISIGSDNAQSGESDEQSISM